MTMKKVRELVTNTTFLIGILFFLTFFTWANHSRVPSGQAEVIQWVTIEEAQEMAKNNPKNVFVDVYTVWCGPCKLMDRTTFIHIEVVQYVNNHYYAVKLNAESDKMVTFNGKQLSERALAKAFQVQGFPTIVLIDEQFKTVSPHLGYLKPDQFKRMLMKFNGEI